VAFFVVAVVERAVVGTPPEEPTAAVVDVTPGAACSTLVDVAPETSVLDVVVVACPAVDFLLLPPHAATMTPSATATATVRPTRPRANRGRCRPSGRSVVDGRGSVYRMVVPSVA
jgi:hypothetical protein